MTWVALVWEMGWCTRVPSSSFSWPLLGSSLNQDLDPPIPKGFLALGGHRPSMGFKDVAIKNFITNDEGK